MINTEITYIPAYTTRDFRNYGVHTANSFYKYTFTVNDLSLLNSGAIKQFPKCMCEYKSIRDVNLNSQKYTSGETIDVTDFDDRTLSVLIKTNVISCDFKPEFKKLDEAKLVKLARLYDCVGMNFKTIASTLELDFEDIKKALGLKQGGATKKAKFEDITKLQKLLEV